MVPGSPERIVERTRGVSPVIGGILLIAVAVLLGVVAGTMVFNLTDDPEPAPEVRFEVESGACGHDIRHVAGEPIAGDRLRIDGVADNEAAADRRLTAGDVTRVDAVDDELAIVWSPPDEGESYVIERFDVDPDTGLDVGCPGTLFTAEAGTIDVIDGNESTVTALSATADAHALGPGRTDLTGDGTDDLPFVDGTGAIKLTNASNDTTTLADGSSIPGNVETQKTRLGVGTWNGSEPGVFFANENHDTLYRVSPDGPPVAVATPGDGVQAVSGVGDIDGDGTDELVFADASQQLRYLEPDGTVKNVPNGQTGSNNGIGAGGLADLDGDGTVRVVAVDGSNDLKLTGVSTADGGEGTTTLTAPNAAKASPTVADLDGDGTDEIGYVGIDAGKVKYVDGVGDTDETKHLLDDAGQLIDGSDGTGLV